MNELTVIFEGLDTVYLAKWDCQNLLQAEWGPMVVEPLHNERGATTEITAKLVTGTPWRGNGGGDRKKPFILDVDTPETWRILSEVAAPGHHASIGRSRLPLTPQEVATVEVWPRPTEVAV